MVLIITTAGGRGAACLDRLMGQIRDGGWRGPRFLVCDGPPVQASGWPIAASGNRQGQRRTYWRALALGVEQTRGARDERFVILEDDVELCRNALQYIEAAPIPKGLDFITWFDGHIMQAGSSPGIYPVPAERFICLQKMTWRRTTAEILLRSPEAAAWPDRHSGDTLIGKILRGRRYGIHVPNLIQHVGAQSICNPGQQLVGVRTANNYPGQRFDAALLTRRGAAPGSLRPPAPRAAWPRLVPPRGAARGSSAGRR